MSSNSKIRESPVVTARAYVLLFDADRHSWVPSGDVQSLSWIQLLQQIDKECFRIVGWRQPDNQIVVNSLLKAGMEYQSHGNFQEWRDPISQSVYGLHFPEGDEAELFFKTVNVVLTKLSTVCNGAPMGKLQPEDMSRNGVGKHLMDPTGPSPGDRASRQSISSGGTATSGLPVGEYAVPAKPPEPTADAKQLQSLQNTRDLSCPGDQVDCDTAARLSHYRQPSTASSASLGYATGGSSHPGSLVVPLPCGAAAAASAASATSAGVLLSSPSCSSSSSGSPSTASSSYGYGYGYGQGSVNGGSSYASASVAAVRAAAGLMTLPRQQQQLLQCRQSDNIGRSESLGVATNGSAGTLSQVDRLQLASICQRPTSPKMTTSHLGDKEGDSHALASSSSYCGGGGLDPFVARAANPPPPPPPLGTVRQPDSECLQANGSRPPPPPPIPPPPPPPPILSSKRKNSAPSGSAAGSPLVATNTESLAAGSSSMSTLEKSSNSSYPSMAVSSTIPPPPPLPPMGKVLRKQSGNKGDAGGSSPTPTGTTALTTTTNTTSPAATSSTTQRGNTSAGGSATLSSMMMREMHRHLEARRRLVDASEAGEGAVPPLHEVTSNTLPRLGGLAVATKSPVAPAPETNLRRPGVLAQAASGSQRTFAPTPSTESVTNHSVGLSSTSGAAAPILKSDLENMRREILNELRREVTSAKNEILDCIRLRKSL